MFNGFYRGKSVLVTGHTGFKGGWLSLWLKKLGADVWGLSLPAPTDPNFHELIEEETFEGQTTGDIRNLGVVATAIKQVRPDIIFHLAAQAIVRRSYIEPIETLNTNAIGTANVLETVRQSGLPCSVIVITSDKCYENREWDFAYRENDPLGGHDVYSMSKAVTELVAQSWYKSFFLPYPDLGPVVTVRAGNVIGGGDYAQDRIMADSVRALIEGKPIMVRNPSAVRPWQHVLECLSGYLWLGARLSREPKTSPLVSPFNFGPCPSARQPVRRLVEEILKHWPGQWTDASTPNAVHEAKLLTLSIDKAAALLNWHPIWDFPEAIRQTVTWYRERHAGNQQDMVGFSRGQIDSYTDVARQKGLSWTAA
jgi:CDP-glucose 4,6-dehydratase